MAKKKDEIFEKLSALKPAVPTVTRLKKKDTLDPVVVLDKGAVLSDVFMNNLTALEKIRKEMLQDIETIYSVVFSRMLETYNVSYEMFRYNMNVFASFFRRK
jgi:hypothetical protein